jgi:MoaD family protein
MNVLYFATLRDVTKKRGEEWHQPAPTLGVLMRDLIARYGSGFEKWVVKDGELAGLAIVLVDGVDSRGLQRLDTPLRPESEVAIFPPVAGG